MSTRRARAGDAVDDVEMELHPALEGDGYWKSKGRQWLLLCPHMSTTAKVGHSILCSLVSERTVIRRFTVAEFAALLTKGAVEVGAEPKTLSVSGAIAVLRDLARLGQITRPDGSPVTFSSRGDVAISVRIWSYPQHECGCYRNVHDALAELRGDGAHFPLAGAGQNSDQAVDNSAPDPAPGQNSDHRGQNSNQSGQNSGRNPGLTCGNADTLSFSPSTSPSTTSCGVCSTSGADACACGPVDADASQQAKRQRRLDAVEADLVAARARAQAAEDAAQPPLPVAWPPVRRDPVKGWVRADVEPDPPAPPPVPRQPKRSKYVRLDEDYTPPDALVRKLNQMFPGIDVAYEASQFTGHYATTDTRRSNWHQVFEKWCERSARFARDRAARGSFQTGRQHQPYQQPKSDQVTDLGYF